MTYRFIKRTGERMYSLIIAEDDDNIRSGLVHLFPWEETGFTVIRDFSNGQAAWNYIKEHPDTTAVLTDVRMPVMDGLELTRRLFENFPDIQVFLISGYQDFTYAQTALRYHVRDFLVKPLRHHMLMLTFLKLKEELDRICAPASETERSNQYYDQIIRAVKAYVMDHLRTATLEEAAFLTHLSSSYLSRLFRGQTGQSFSDYLLQKRMERACSMLTDARHKIYEISDAIGYDNPKNFSRAFRNYYHLSPREYREGGGKLP
ncbi:AraC family two component transcriptional regulator [Cuneatibacter caecimuris]|uniref:Stage 0 sporulation protein A homolog n=2 Tax=Cuneatibacter caecimuris TaxID=1796618 RepID=A0A4Q7PP66_9FIRM|nr:AraC family two component transcriptional regulator [Cuneatibacter caecimuris]